MKKVLILSFWIAFSLFPLAVPKFILASESDSCESNNITVSFSPTSAQTGSGPVTVSIVVNVDPSAPIDPNLEYQVAFESAGNDDLYSDAKSKLIIGDNDFKIIIPQGTKATYEKVLLECPGCTGIDEICQFSYDYPATKANPVFHCQDDIKTPGTDETGTCLDPAGDPGCCDCGGVDCNACTTCPAAPPPGGGGGTVTPPCHTEFDPVGSDTGVNTGLGCIPTQPQDLVKWILKYAILMGGGIAFLLSVFGGVSIILAGGNPEKINAGKEIIGSALTGLLFIIFSVFLLRFIGFDILQLPGFSNP